MSKVFFYLFILYIYFFTYIAQYDNVAYRENVEIPTCIVFSPVKRVVRIEDRYLHERKIPEQGSMKPFRVTDDSGSLKNIGYIGVKEEMKKIK